MKKCKPIKANNAVEPATGKFKHKGFKVGRESLPRVATPPILKFLNGCLMKN